MQNDLEELERALAEAEITAPLPWAVKPVERTRFGGDTFDVDENESSHLVDRDGSWVGSFDGAEEKELAVAAVNALPSLIEEVKRLREENARQIQWTVGLPPCNSGVIYGHSWGPYRWHPYSPKSERYRAGVNGRWQRMNEFAGWENAPPPNEWATEKAVEARASLSPMEGE